MHLTALDKATGQKHTKAAIEIFEEKKHEPASEDQKEEEKGSEV